MMEASCAEPTDGGVHISTCGYWKSYIGWSGFHRQVLGGLLPLTQGGGSKGTEINDLK